LKIQQVIPVDGTTFDIFGAGTVSTEMTANSIISFHKICGQEFKPILNFFAKSKCNLIESCDHQLQNNDIIYIGQSVVDPDINGCQPNVCVVTEDTFTLGEFGTDPCFSDKLGGVYGAVQVKIHPNDTQNDIANAIAEHINELPTLWRPTTANIIAIPPFVVFENVLNVVVPLVSRVTDAPFIVIFVKD